MFNPSSMILINNATGYNFFLQTLTIYPNVLALNSLYITYYGNYINIEEIDTVNGAIINGHLLSLNKSILTCSMINNNSNLTICNEIGSCQLK